MSFARWGVWTALLSSAVLSFPLNRAQASGFAVAHFAGEQGSVVATNPTALYFNPGALGFAPSASVLVDGQLALRRLTWQHAPGVGDVPEPAGAAGANYGTARALNVFGGPMIGGIYKLGDLALSAGVFAPFAGSVHFDQNSAFANSKFPGAVDGVARWLGYEASTMSIYGSLGAAYRLGPVSLGLSGNLIYTTLSFSRAQNAGAGAGINDVENEGRSVLDVHGLHGSFAVGAMWEAIANTLWLGASYQAQPGLGAMNLNGNLQITPLVVMPSETLTRRVTFHQALPDVVRIGARYRARPSLELRLFGDRTRWSVMQTQCVGLQNQPCTVTADGGAVPGSGTVTNFRRAWRDTYGVRAGASYWVVPRVETFAGLGYETAAEPDATLEPVLADANNILGAVGARVELMAGWFVAASYTHLQFLSRNNTGASTLADATWEPVTRTPDGGGRYTQWVGLFDANVSVQF